MANQQTKHTTPRHDRSSIPTTRTFHRNKAYKRKAQLWIYNPFLLVLTNLLSLSLYISPATSSPHTVRLTSTASRTCGSGILLNSSRILTTAHVARSLCTSTRCVQLQIRGSLNKRMVEREFTQAIVERYSGALDLAVLNLAEPFVDNNIAEVRLATSMPALGTDILVRGYPECGDEVTTSGKIVTQGKLQSISSAQGKPGSSGSGVFNEEGELLGVVDQAAHLSGVFAYHLFGSSFNLTFVNSPVVSSILAGDAFDSLIQEAKVLNSFFQEEVVSTTGWRRLVLSDQFLSVTDSFHQRLGQVSPSLEDLRILTYLRGYPGRELHELLHEVTPTTAEQATEQVLLLTVSAMLERHGFQAALLQPLLPTTVRALIEQSPTPISFRTKALDIVNRFEASRYQGFKIMLFTTMGSAALLVAFILILWAFSLGYVLRYLADVPFRLYRLWILFVVAFGFWPLSLFIFWFKEYRRRKRLLRSIPKT
jgi:V8-like Glu-specific endopeptidase